MSTALGVTMKERCFFPQKTHKGFSLEVQDSLVSRKEEFVLSQTLTIVKGKIRALFAILTHGAPPFVEI